MYAADSKDYRSSCYNEVCHLIQRYTEKSTPPPTHHVSAKHMHQPQLHVHVIQDDGGTDQQSSQDRPPASDLSATLDRSTTPQYQDSPTRYQDIPTIHQDNSTKHQDSPTRHQDSPTTHQDTTDEDGDPPVPQVYTS